MSDAMHRTVELSRGATEALLRVSTATLTSQLLRRGFRSTFLAGLLPQRPDLRMVGYAFTLRYVPSREDVGFQVNYDNDRDIQRRAVETVGAMDVLVIDARSEMRSASFGHIIATRIWQRGAAGLVTDGALRDRPSFASLELPSYCRGSHATTSSVAHLAADLNVPISCAGVLVMPGDVVVGDAEGWWSYPPGLPRKLPPMPSSKRMSRSSHSSVYEPAHRSGTSIRLPKACESNTRPGGHVVLGLDSWPAIWGSSFMLGFVGQLAGGCSPDPDTSEPALI
jgi:regulator of RNase E activity RraA